jgi:LPXTG-motif cell wall-anchored protein
MKPGTARETAIICAAAVVALGVLTIPFDLRAKTGDTSSKALIWLVLLGVAALGLLLGFRYLTARKRPQARGSQRPARLPARAERLHAEDPQRSRIGPAAAIVDG